MGLGVTGFLVTGLLGLGVIGFLATGFLGLGVIGFLGLGVTGRFGAEPEKEAGQFFAVALHERFLPPAEQGALAVATHMMPALRRRLGCQALKTYRPDFEQEHISPP